MPEHQKPRVPWYASPPFLGFVSIIALILSILSVAPFYVSYFGGPQIDGSIELISIMTGTILVVFIAVASYMLWANHRLINNVLLHKHIESNSQKEIESLKIQLAREIETREDIRRDRDHVSMAVAEKFRELALARKGHSAYLYGLQKIIHDTPDLNRAESIFTSSWDRHKQFLGEYCTSVSNIFSAIAGRECCASVKIMWDGRKYRKFPDHTAHTEYGIPIEPKIPNDIVLYRTIARCHISKYDYLRPVDEIGDRVLEKNIIYRRLYRGQLNCYTTSDIQSDINQWKAQVTTRDLVHSASPFQFPDDDTPYKSMIALPLFVNTEVNRSEGLHNRTEAVQLFLGILSIDSKETIEFKHSLYMKMGFQIADDIVSCCFEYFRCVRHLEYRMRVQNLNIAQGE